MRKLGMFLIVFILAVSLAAPVFAKNMGDKLTRGAANIITGLFGEIGKNIDKEWTASNNAAIGVFTGFIKGTVLGICRTGSGIWDLVTFPINLPKDYEPLVKPDYLVEIK